MGKVGFQKKKKKIVKVVINLQGVVTTYKLAL